MITLDCRGQVLYCAPQSPVLGSALEDSAASVFRRNLRIRRKIIASNCSNCIHDYPGEGGLREGWHRLQARYWGKRFSIDAALKAAQKLKPRRCKVSVTGQGGGHYLIVGWYGTETAGDKAILDEILQQIRSEAPGARIAVASLYPYVTRWTVGEMGWNGVEVIPTYGRQFHEAAARSDVVVMGGGPLMHLEELGPVLHAFVRSKHAGHATWILGCGIGPLDRGERYQAAVAEILRLADRVDLRDSRSASRARALAEREGIRVSGDPAQRYVSRWACRHPRPPQAKGGINLYLREWSREYGGRLTAGEFLARKGSFEKELAGLVRMGHEEFGLEPGLYAMHHFYVGGDDREFNRRFVREYLGKMPASVEVRPLSPSEILSTMQRATLCVCMRYHSVVFADTLGVPYVAIDYTMGGKIGAYLEDAGRGERMLSLKQVAEGDWQSVFKRLAREAVR
jgi:polysaccharide pyruvyl transferase WcaK-like protein